MLNDRSVLYKYMNPNLVAIVTQGADNVFKCMPPSFLLSFVSAIRRTEDSRFHYCFADVLNVHLVDVVSGSVVSTINHRRVRGPVNIVHSENWLVYTYYNDKVRRTELSEFRFRST